MKIFGGIDAGGSTFKCAVVDREANILSSQRFKTRTPRKTLSECLKYFANHELEISALGIASFGPLNVNPKSRDYGCILSTPKPDWSGADLRSYFKSRLNIPVAIDTDVNGALEGEKSWGAAIGVDSAAYVTIGTGIGAGFFVSDKYLGYPTHSEFGHIPLSRHKMDEFEGLCPFHGDCLEGMASAKALSARFGPTKEIEQTHFAWDLEAFYLAQACISIYLTVRPERIILGGGIMLAAGLLDKVRTAFVARINGYTGITNKEISDLIVTPGLGDNAGVLGAARLAMNLQTI